MGECQGLYNWIMVVVVGQILMGFSFPGGAALPAQGQAGTVVLHHCRVVWVALISRKTIVKTRTTPTISVNFYTFLTLRSTRQEHQQVVDCK